MYLQYYLYVPTTYNAVSLLPSAQSKKQEHMRTVSVGQEQTESGPKERKRMGMRMMGTRTTTKNFQ